MERTVRLLPDGTGEIRIIAGNHTNSDRWVHLAEASVLAPAASRVPELIAQVTRDGAQAVLWSGSFAQRDEGGLFEDDPRTWGPKGWAAFEEGLRSLGPLAQRLIIRTHARHVVGDVPGCKRFLDNAFFRQTGARLLIDPAGTVTPDMLSRNIAEDHLRRMFEQLVDMLDGGIGLELLAGVVLASTQGDGTVGLKAGDHRCSDVVRASASLVPAGVDLVVLDPSDWPV